jgi:hypothetical protein
MELRDWYRVRLSDAGIELDVRPPGKPPWQALIHWEDIIRVCYRLKTVYCPTAGTSSQNTGPRVTWCR